MSIMEKVGRPSRDGEDGEFLCEDPAFREQYPGLWEFMSRCKWHGEERKCGRITLYYEDGKAGLCLSDAETLSCAFHVDEGVNEALEGAESRLQAGKMDWRKTRRYR
jgi:hypothetical protein